MGQTRRFGRVVRATVGAAVAGLGITMIVGSPAHAQVQNGSFESPAITGPSQDYEATESIGPWLVGGQGVTLARTLWQAAAGAQSVDLSDSGTLHQEISTVIGDTYLVRFALAGDPFGGDLVKSVGVVFGDTTKFYDFNISGATAQNMGWVYVQFTAVATPSVTPNTTRLFFKSEETNPFGPVIDDVTVVRQVPPTTTTLAPTTTTTGPGVPTTTTTAAPGPTTTTRPPITTTVAAPTTTRPPTTTTSRPPLPRTGGEPRGPMRTSGYLIAFGGALIALARRPRGRHWIARVAGPAGRHFRRR